MTQLADWCYFNRYALLFGFIRTLQGSDNRRSPYFNGYALLLHRQKFGVSYRYVAVLILMDMLSYCNGAKRHFDSGNVAVLILMDMLSYTTLKKRKLAMMVAVLILMDMLSYEILGETVIGQFSSQSLF